MEKLTLVIGASENPDRYSNRAILSLKKHNQPIVALGLKEGEVDGIKILNNKPQLKDIDTVTLYVGPKNQSEWIDYIIDLKPKRLIFNPGTENSDFFEKANSSGIDCINACTLVLLSTQSY